MIKVRLENGSEVILKNTEWISADPELAVALNDLTSGVLNSSAYYPDKDEALALNVIQKLGGKITFQDELDYSIYPEGVCF